VIQIVTLPSLRLINIKNQLNSKRQTKISCAHKPG